MKPHRDYQQPHVARSSEVDASPGIVLHLPQTETAALFRAADIVGASVSELAGAIIIKSIRDGALVVKKDSWA